MEYLVKKPLVFFVHCYLSLPYIPVSYMNSHRPPHNVIPKKTEAGRSNTILKREDF